MMSCLSVVMDPLETTIEIVVPVILLSDENFEDFISKIVWYRDRPSTSQDLKYKLNYIIAHAKSIDGGYEGIDHLVRKLAETDLGPYDVITPRFNYGPLKDIWLIRNDDTENIRIETSVLRPEGYAPGFCVPLSDRLKNKLNSNIINLWINETKYFNTQFWNGYGSDKAYIL